MAVEKRKKNKIYVFTSIKHFLYQYNFFVIDFGNVIVILQILIKWYHIYYLLKILSKLSSWNFKDANIFCTKQEVQDSRHLKVKE